MRDPVVPEKRRAFTPTQKAEIRAKSDGHCAYPGCMISERLEYDHVIARDLGGLTETRNGAALCSAHHKQKTGLDKKLIAKAGRLRANEDGSRTPTRRPLKGRPFSPSKRTFPKRAEPWKNR